MKRIAAFGSIGALLGFFIGFMIDWATSDGLNCIPTGQTYLGLTPDKMTPIFSDMTTCWVVVLVCTAVMGSIGATFGLVTKSMDRL